MPGPDEALPETSDAPRHSDGSLDDAALDGLSGGRLPQTDAAPPLSWSDVLTDPNVAVPFDPTPGEATTRTLHDVHDKTVDDTKPAFNVTYANW